MNHDPYLNPKLIISLLLGPTIQRTISGLGGKRKEKKKDQVIM